MLKTVASYYETAISPVVHQTWDKLPKEKLITAAKVIGAAFILLKLYQAYQSYQALKDQVSQLSTKLKTANTEIDKLKKLPNDLTALAKKTGQLSTKFNRVDQSLKTLWEEYTGAISASCYGGNSARSFAVDDADVSAIQRPSPEATPEIEEEVSQEKTQLELFCEKFPGSDLKCKVGSEETTFDKYFLQSFLGIDETTTCEPGEDGWYTLTFQREPKDFIIKHLPHKEDQSQFEQGVRTAFWALAKLITIKFQLSNVVRLQIEKYKDATKIVLDPTAFSMSQGLDIWKYTAHFRSITIFDEPLDNGYRFILEVEHNTSVPIKDASMDHQKFVELLELNK
ncbi:MAG: hypothetical protein ABSA17_03065 [Rhabdochlamydiaceae bacterium]